MTPDTELSLANQINLQEILQISRRMAETRALTPLLNYVVEEAIKLVGAERGYVVLVKPDGSLDFPITRDQDGHSLDDAEDQISTTVLHEVVETGEPLILRNALTDPRFSKASSVVILQLRSIMCVPLVSRGENIGAVYVENRAIRNRFSEKDVTPLILFANQAAVAIENAALNDELESRVKERTHDLEQAMRQVEESWHEAIEANRMRTVWLSQIAHDLRAPLGIVTGAISLLKEEILGEINAEQREWVDKAMKSVQHVTHLTEDIFDLSKIDEHALKLSLQPVDLKALLETTIEVAQGLPWPESVSLKLEIVEPLPQIYVDPVRIQQVLFNLITNAQHYIETGRVTLAARHVADEQAVHISVADTGAGIAPDQIERLFDRFQQADQSTRVKGSSGLGLAICRQLVEMHHGKIWAKSNPGAGSTFTFSLPLNTNGQVS